MLVGEVERLDRLLGGHVRGGGDADADARRVALPAAGREQLAGVHELPGATLLHVVEMGRDAGRIDMLEELWRRQEDALAPRLELRLARHANQRVRLQPAALPRERRVGAVGRLLRQYLRRRRHADACVRQSGAGPRRGRVRPPDRGLRDVLELQPDGVRTMVEARRRDSAKYFCVD